MKAFPFIILPGVFLAAGSQAAPPSLDTVVVTATRTATTADRVPVSVTVLDGEAIDRSGANDMGEVLRGVSGIDIGRNGGPGQTTSLFIRGANSDHSLVLLNGVPINPGTIGVAAIQNIDPGLVERVEIVRGPLSSLYGSSAIGGVVNIITEPDMAEGTRRQFAARAGSFDSQSANAGTRLRRGPMDFHGSLSLQRSDGFPTRSTDAFDSGFRNLSLTAGLGYRTGSHRFALQAFGARGNTEYSSFFGTPLDQDFENSVLAATLDSALSERWSARLVLSRTTDFIEQQQPNFLADRDFARTTRYRLDWQNDLAWATGHTLVAGALFETENTDALSFGSRFDEDRDNAALYLQNQFGSGPRDLVAALRVAHYDGFGNHLTWNLGYGHRLGDSTRLRASAGTAFRAPSGTDLYGFGGNPALEPERSRALELGLQQRLSKLSSVEWSVYRATIKDLISYTGVFPAGRNDNVNRAEITGTELSYEYSGDPWRLRLGMDWKRPRDESNDQWLARRARISGTAALDFRRADWTAGLDVLYQGERKDTAFNDAVLAPYTLVNATARWQVSRAVSLEGRVENLLDRDYELAGGFNTPERSYYAGLRITDD